VTLLAASDNENVKEDEHQPEDEITFKTVRDSQSKLAKGKVLKRKANDFPGHYPMTRKAKLKTCESAPQPASLFLKQKFSLMSPTLK
jgi:hypothetical protein